NTYIKTHHNVGVPVTQLNCQGAGGEDVPDDEPAPERADQKVGRSDFLRREGHRTPAPVGVPSRPRGGRHGRFVAGGQRVRTGGPVRAQP
ncbi:hypothetical protein, partial [Kitasatospora purpeofusca]|uniref:hypothetical protein n=1 Tax=Kitasatospora purpeofusca TaxID=67352 RepID=UPI00368C08F8